MVKKNTRLVLRFSSRFVSGVVILVDGRPCCFICRCPIVVFIDLSKFFFIKPSARPGHVSSKYWLIALRIIVFVGIKSAAWKHFANYVFIVWAIILFTVGFDCCVVSVTYHINFCLLLVPLNICCPLICTLILCWSSVMVHPSSHRNQNYMGGAVIILG